MKKTSVKILTLVLAMIFLLSSTVMAMPANTVVIGDKAFSIGAIIKGVDGIQSALDASNGKLYYSIDGQTKGFLGLFDGKEMTQAQKDELKNIQYVDENGKTTVYPTFDEELTVKSATAVNATTISVVFSNDVTQQFTVAALAAGKNTRTVKYLDKDYSVEVEYTLPTPAVVTVQEVKRDNYRHFQVIFSGEVDLKSAEKPENYYFFINEGNADYKSILPAANNLKGVAEKIVASNKDGKTVADIYLPEYNRFTNIADLLPQMLCAPAAEYLQQIPAYNGWYEVYGFDTQAWIDDEQSIVVNLANKVHGTNSAFWALTAGREVQVAVRNIRDLQGDRSIDTAVLPMIIKDDVRPEWTGVKQVENQFVEEIPIPRENLAATPVVPVYTDGSEMVQLSFNEPVFNTHGLGVGDINNQGHDNVEVAVDDNKVASTNDSTNFQGLDGILKFHMSAEDTYAEACVVDLNIKAAIEKAYSDGFRADNTYTIKITGITDLAGNLTNPQVLEFKVKLLDQTGDDPVVIPAPKIIDVKQIHDNIFRVYINNENVTGKFEIRNGDGEDGLIECNLVDFPAKSYTVDKKVVWYRDVIVAAVDREGTNDAGIRNDQLLAYDSQNTLKRTLRISEVADPINSLTGDSFEYLLANGNGFTINKDISAPVVAAPAAITLKEGEVPGSVITLDVKDIVPDTWAKDAGTAQPVYAMLYDYTVQQQVNNLPYGLFDYNSIDTAATEWYNTHSNSRYMVDNPYSDFDLLPVIVSYTKDGVKHSAVVSNRCLLNEFANYPGESGRHYGAQGSINFENQKLSINLAAYKDLLDSTGNLVQGVKYEIEIPGGYFADQGKFNAYNFVDWNSNAVNSDNALYFVPQDKVLYVSEGRNNNCDDKVRPYRIPPTIGDEALASYMVHGYTSAAATVAQVVGIAPVTPPEVKDAVPQTSKELINWFEDRNEIWVEFTGPDADHMDKATLSNPANYVLNDKTLAAMGVTSNDIKYVVSSENLGQNGDLRQFAEIKLPYDSISVDGDYLFKVSGVSNIAGGTMTPVEVRLDIDENFRPIIEKAVVIGDHEIELTFNESVRYIADPKLDPKNLAVAAKDNFVVYVNGTAFTPMTATVGTTPWNGEYPNPTYPLNKVIRLNLGSVELLGDSVTSITVDVVKNNNDKLLLEDSKCNPLNDNVDPFAVTVVK